jgi:hypothetical protein
MSEKRGNFWPKEALILLLASVAEPHHLFAAPGPSKNLKGVPAPW